MLKTSDVWIKDTRLLLWRNFKLLRYLGRWQQQEQVIRTFRVLNVRLKKSWDYSPMNCINWLLVIHILQAWCSLQPLQWMKHSMVLVWKLGHFFPILSGDKTKSRGACHFFLTDSASMGTMAIPAVLARRSLLLGIPMGKWDKVWVDWFASPGGRGSLLAIDHLWPNQTTALILIKDVNQLKMIWENIRRKTGEYEVFCGCEYVEPFFFFVNHD